MAGEFGDFGGDFGDLGMGTDWNSIAPTYSGQIDMGGGGGGGGWEGQLPNTGGGVWDTGGNTFVGSGGGLSPGVDYSNFRGDIPQHNYNAQFTGYTPFSNSGAGGSAFRANVGGGYPAGGGGGYPGQQPYQRVALGTPERTLFDRYSSLLQNPAGMATDPAYQFLFNQGMQAFNRTAAANRQRSSGGTALGAEKYGQGMAYDYMNKLLPQYRGGAQEELSRFMGPSGLLPNYANLNNNVNQMQGSEAAAQQLIPYYQQLLSSGGGGMGNRTMSPGAVPNTGASFNGLTNAPRLSPEILQQMAQGGGNDDWNTFLDQSRA